MRIRLIDDSVSGVDKRQIKLFNHIKDNLNEGIFEINTKQTLVGYNHSTSLGKAIKRLEEKGKIEVIRFNSKYITNTKEYYQEYHLSKTFGITLEDYNNILLAQDNGCCICGTTQPGGKNGRFMVDHCHTTGKIRGLLCHNCNVGLGVFKDNPLNLTRAYKYLMNIKEVILTNTIKQTTDE